MQYFFAQDRYFWYAWVQYFKIYDRSPKEVKLILIVTYSIRRVCQGVAIFCYGKGNCFKIIFDTREIERIMLFSRTSRNISLFIKIIIVYIKMEITAVAYYTVGQLFFVSLLRIFLLYTQKIEKPFYRFLIQYLLLNLVVLVVWPITYFAFGNW